ncbi:MAG: hypothetical protein RQ723_10145 [Desulfuromonadales bacterium]|nr:hypothetical protein [Desulfuromonadales bacterium]
MMSDNERQQWREFRDFVNAAEVAPGAALDARVTGDIDKALRREPWWIGCKMTLVQVASGLATLTVCPQFGLGWGDHLPWHAGHAGAPAVLFSLVCGMLFVSCGGLLCALLLRRSELARAHKMSVSYFLGYAGGAYLVLLLLGTEAFLFTSLAWIPGAVLGNLAGFSAGHAVRRRLA